MAEQACPGGCNYRWRKAREAWQEAVAGYDPLDPRQTRPDPPDLAPWAGDPWCPRCKSVLRRELAEIDDLASILAAMTDGHRGRRPGAKMPHGKQSHAPSPSPAGDMLEELQRDISNWETAARGTDPLARRGFLATELTTSVAWLTAHFDRVIIMGFAEDFGAEITRWHKALRRVTSAGTGVQHKPVRCPRCDEYALWWTEGADHVECRGKGGTCGRLISMDDFDALAEAQEAEHRQARSAAGEQAAARPAA